MGRYVNSSKTVVVKLVYLKKREEEVEVDEGEVDI